VKLYKTSIPTKSQFFDF